MFFFALSEGDYFVTSLTISYSFIRLFYNIGNLRIMIHIYISYRVGVLYKNIMRKEYAPTCIMTQVFAKLITVVN